MGLNTKMKMKKEYFKAILTSIENPNVMDETVNFRAQMC